MELRCKRLSGNPNACVDSPRQGTGEGSYHEIRPYQRVEKGLEVLQELGANLQEVTIPSLEYVRAANSVIMLSEAYAYHEPNLKTRPQDFGEMVRARFRIGGLFSASDYVQAQRCRKLVIRECAEVFKRVDLLVTPTMTQPAAAFEGYDASSTVRGPSFTAPFNLTGLPAISVPCGFTAAGLPVGMFAAVAVSGVWHQSFALLGFAVVLALLWLDDLRV